MKLVVGTIGILLSMLMLMFTPIIVGYLTESFIASVIASIICSILLFVIPTAIFNWTCRY